MFGLMPLMAMGAQGMSRFKAHLGLAMGVYFDTGSASASGGSAMAASGEMPALAPTAAGALDIMA